MNTTFRFRVISVIAFAALVIDGTQAASSKSRSTDTYVGDQKVAKLIAQVAAAKKKKDFDHVISACSAALQLKPNAALAGAIYGDRGSAYINKGELERAMHDANESIRLNPKLFQGYRTRGGVYRRRGEFDKAITDYNKAIELNPNLPYLHVNRAVAFSEKGDEQRALRDLNEAIRRGPNLADAYADRGLVYYNLGQYERALADYNKGIKLNPAAPSPYFNRGLLFKKTGKMEAAVRDYSTYISRGTPSADAYRLRGRAYAAMASYRQAAADFQKAAQLDPKSPKILNELAWLKATCPDSSYRDGKQALRVSTQLCHLTKWSNSDYLDTLAAACAETGDFEKAVQYQNQAVKFWTSENEDKDRMRARVRVYQQHQPFRDVRSR
jgi:tetratricopeptide (TPR) repeat protein